MRGSLDSALCASLGMTLLYSLILRSGQAEALSGAGFGLGFFFFAVLGWGGGLERIEEAGADGCNFVDGCVEGFFVCFRGLVEAADLPDELQRSVANLRVGHGWIEVEEVFDVSAHGEIIGRVGRPEKHIPSGMTNKESKSNDNSRSSACGEG